MAEHSDSPPTGTYLRAFSVQRDGNWSWLVEAFSRLPHIGDSLRVVLMGTMRKVHTGDVHSVQNHLLQHGYRTRDRAYKE